MHSPEPMDTACVGRILIDLPRGFAPALPISAFFVPVYHGAAVGQLELKVLLAESSDAMFSASLGRRQTELLNSGDETTDILNEVLTREAATVFRIQRIKQSYTSELHRLIDGIHISVEADSFESRFGQAEAELEIFAKGISGLKMTSHSSEGFCVGPVLVDGRHTAESTSMTFRSDAHPDVTIAIEVATFAPDEPVTLLQRMDGQASILDKFDSRHIVLRKRDLNVSGIMGQEWLGAVNLGEDRSEKRFGFAFETRRISPRNASPRIHIEFDTGQNDIHGKGRKTSLSDQQATALWDSIIHSIRLRDEKKSKEE